MLHFARRLSSIIYVDIIIRRAAAPDLDTLVSAIVLMAQESEQVTLNPAITRRGIDAVLQDPHKGFYLIAFADGKPAGCLLITYEWSDWHNRNMWWIQSVYVFEEFRGKGIWDALYSHVKKLAAAQEIKNVRLYVYQGNQTAIRAYEKSGLKGGHYVVME